MDNLEKVEKLRERANVSYAEAKEALEKTNWDVLDAMVFLEQNGKATGPQQQAYTTNNSYKEPQPEPEYHYETKSNFRTGMDKLADQLKRLLKTGNQNVLDVIRKDEVILSMPLTIFVILLLCAFWVVIPLMVVGLFAGIRYSFRGPGKVHSGVNKVMDMATEKAEKAKMGFMESTSEGGNSEAGASGQQPPYRGEGQ